jgi:hypothetical protein
MTHKLDDIRAAHKKVVSAYEIMDTQEKELALDEFDQQSENYVRDLLVVVDLVVEAIDNSYLDDFGDPHFLMGDYDNLCDAVQKLKDGTP